MINKRLPSDSPARIRFRIAYSSDGVYIFRYNGSGWGPWYEPPYNVPMALWATIKNNNFERVKYKM